MFHYQNVNGSVPAIRQLSLDTCSGNGSVLGQSSLLTLGVEMDSSSVAHGKLDARVQLPDDGHEEMKVSMVRTDPFAANPNRNLNLPRDFGSKSKSKITIKNFAKCLNSMAVHPDPLPRMCLACWPRP